MISPGLIIILLLVGGHITQKEAEVLQKGLVVGMDVPNKWNECIVQFESIIKRLLIKK